MPSHDIATDEVLPYIEAELEHYPELIEARVTFDVLLAFGDENQPAGVKHQGFPSVGTYKINGPTLRKRGISDVTLIFEGEDWRRASEPERNAMIGYYLAFLAVQRDSKGVIKEDEAYRPKLKSGLPDYRIAGFRSVASRHGAASIEYQDYTAFREHFGHLFHHAHATPPVARESA